MLNKYFCHTNIASTQNVWKQEQRPSLPPFMLTCLSLTTRGSRLPAQLCWRVMFANVKRGRNILAYRPHSEEATAGPSTMDKQVAVKEELVEESVVPPPACRHA